MMAHIHVRSRWECERPNSCEECLTSSVRNTPSFVILGRCTIRSPCLFIWSIERCVVCSPSNCPQMLLWWEMSERSLKAFVPIPSSSKSLTSSLSPCCLVAHTLFKIVQSMSLLQQLIDCLHHSVLVELEADLHYLILDRWIRLKVFNLLTLKVLSLDTQVSHC